MNRLAGLLLGLLTLPGTLLAQGGAGASAPNYYPLKSGTKWTYRLLVGGQQRGTMLSQIAKTETVDGKELARLEASVNGQVLATEHLQQTAEGVYRHKINDIAVTTPVLLIKYPVKDGDKWEIDTAAGQEQIKGNAVVGQEEVEVPAGKYKAVKVTMDIVVANTNQKLSTTYWFADGVGIVKQNLNVGGLNVVQELEKYEAAK